MIRVCKDGKKKYVSLGVSVLPQFWDFEKSKPKRNCPNKIMIDKLIASKMAEYNALVVDMIAERKEYTPQLLAHAIEQKNQGRTVAEMYDRLFAEMRKSERLGNLAVYKYSFNSLMSYTRNKLDIPFRDIDCLWLKRYEEWLHARGCRDTTISQLFRTLRSVFNKAIEQEIIKQDAYPFNKFKINKFDIHTEKRAISKEEVQRILAFEVSDSCFYFGLAKDLFLFSYFGARINFSDIALLRFCDLRDGRVCYVRKKTGKPINFPLNDISTKIAKKYARPSMSDGDYIFPILDSGLLKTEQQKRDRIRKSLKKINWELKTLGELIGLETPLTTYVARHTFATVLKRSGVSVALISESLGHSDLSTTQIYLDSFENSQIDAAMSHLL